MTNQGLLFGEYNEIIWRYGMTEQQLQAKCFLWFWNEFPSERGMLFHVDNNSANRIVGNQKRSLGVVKGVADFIFFLRDGRSVCIEMKIDGGSQSEAQKEFENKLLDRRHLYFICYDFVGFQDLIYKLLT